MLVHGLFIESVDLRRVGGSASGNDVLGDRFDGCQIAAGEKKIGSLRRKGAYDSAADRASGSVDHRNLVLQHHLWFLLAPGWSPADLMSQHLVRAVNDVDTAISARWAPANRPVRQSAGVYTGWKCDKVRVELRASVIARRRAEEDRADMLFVGERRRRRIQERDAQAA